MGFVWCVLCRVRDAVTQLIARFGHPEALFYFAPSAPSLVNTTPELFASTQHFTLEHYHYTHTHSRTHTHTHTRTHTHTHTHTHACAENLRVGVVGCMAAAQV